MHWKPQRMDRTLPRKDGKKKKKKKRRKGLYKRNKKGGKHFSPIESLKYASFR
jgi:hypothetical protein